MRRIEYVVDFISEDAVEAMMGLFAIKYSDFSSAILCSDGMAFIVNLADYDAEQSDAGENLIGRQGIIQQYELNKPDNFLTSRAQLAARLNTANVPTSIFKLRTAAPLNGDGELEQDTLMYRFTAGPRDICFSRAKSELRRGTYLTPENDVDFVNTGYGVVGRYSLPVPHPARFLHRYLLQKGTKFKVGTVEPQFNQSGGGVEIKLDNPTTPVTLISTDRIDDY